MEIYCTSSAQQSVDIYISSHQGFMYPACFLEIRWNDEIILSNETRCTLKNNNKHEHDLIETDLARLKRNKILSTERKGCFTRIEQRGEVSEEIYLYCHEEYRTFSDTKFTNIRKCCRVVYEESMELDPCHHEHHDYLLSYIHSNAYLNDTVYPRILQGADEQRKEKVQELHSCLQQVLAKQTTDLRFAHGSALPHQRHYEEDAWSKRLFHSLKSGFEGFSGEYTADLRGRGTSQVLSARIPDGTPQSAFLFHGGSDFTIKKSPVYVSYHIESESDESTSGDSARGEQAHQMHGMVPDSLTSGIPGKAGQLVAAVHQSIVAKAIRKAIKGKDLVYPLTGYGLLLHKADGVSLFEVQLSPPRSTGGTSLVVKARFCDSTLTGETVCQAVITLMRYLNPPRTHPSTTSITSSTSTISSTSSTCTSHSQ